MKLLRCIVFFFIPFSLSAQEIFWQSYINVEHPLTGAKDTAWFGIGDVEPGYNPYLDSLFYGNYDSLPDIRILGSEHPAFDEEVYYHDFPDSICGDLHRSIKPLSVLNSTSYNIKFHFMVWVDESGFAVDTINPENSQHAYFGIDTASWQQLLSQNVASLWGMEEDSVILYNLRIIINSGDADYYHSLYYRIIDSYLQVDDWWHGSTIIERDTTLLAFALNEPLCPSTNSTIKSYHIRLYSGFDIIPNTAISTSNIASNTAFPNPTSGMLHGLGKHEKHLYNAQGKRLLSTQAAEIDLSPYPNGLYFIKTPHNAHRIVKH